MTRGIPRGVVCGLVGDVALLGKGIGWGSPVVSSTSEPIYPTLDNVTGECAELKRVVKLVDDPERACPSET